MVKMMEASRVREVLDYDKSTGVMTWRVKHRNGKPAGCRRKDGYYVIRIDYVLQYRHRLAWLHTYGIHPTYTIDHINGIKGDDRLANLRDVQIEIDSQNQRRPKLPQTLSGYLGVQKNHGGWQGHITVKGRRHLLGTYKTPEEAHQAYIAAKRRMHEGCTI